MYKATVKGTLVHKMLIINDAIIASLGSLNTLSTIQSSQRSGSRNGDSFLSAIMSVLSGKCGNFSLIFRHRSVDTSGITSYLRLGFIPVFELLLCIVPLELRAILCSMTLALRT